MTPVVLQSPDRQKRVTVNVEGIDPPQYQQVSDRLGVELKRASQMYIGVSNAMQLALRLCPQANPADLWVHLIYNQFRTRYRRSDRSWKRVSGQALEQVVVDIYTDRLRAHQIRIRFGKAADAELLGLVERGLGSSKTDLVIEKEHNGRQVLFGVIHCKASIAERLTDDAPASSALIEQGYWSSVVTIDAKMFPPPHGDGIVRGELGITKGGDKRRYFEIAGQFSGCYSFNLNSPPSVGQTASGSRINSLSFSEPQPDVLVQDILKAWQTFVLAGALAVAAQQPGAAAAITAPIAKRLRPKGGRP
jgi:hypothetical protein